MELSPKTKVNDLIARYPFLKDFLINLNPEFKMLDNPFMRKTVGRIASLGKVAMIGGMEVKKLLDDIAVEIKKKTGESVTVSYGEGGPDEQEVRIDTLKNIIKELHAGKDVENQKKKFGELIKDVAFSIHPLTDIDPDHMFSQLKGLPLLQGWRGSPPRDIDALREVLLRFSALIEDIPEIAAVEINPLMVFDRGKGTMAVDARILFRPEIEG